MKVVHCKKENYDIYIGRGRGCVCGNPYSYKEGTLAKYKTDTRDEAIDKYREYILNNENLLDRLHELKGKTLGCSCVPKRCHGDILIELIERLN